MKQDQSHVEPIPIYITVLLINDSVSFLSN